MAYNFKFSVLHMLTLWEIKDEKMNLDNFLNDNFVGGNVLYRPPLEFECFS